MKPPSMMPQVLRHGQNRGVSKKKRKAVHEVRVPPEDNPPDSAPTEIYYNAWSFEVKAEVDLTCWPFDSEEAVKRGISRVKIRRAGDVHLSKLCVGLVSLDLSGSHLTDLGLKSLRRLKQLTFLDISQCDCVTDRGICSLRKLRAFKAKRLQRVTDLGVTECLGAMRQTLEEVDLSYCSRLGPEVFALMPRAMKRLDLSGLPRIDDDAFGQILSEQTMLTSLTVRDSALTDKKAALVLTSTKTPLSGHRKRHNAIVGLRQIDFCGSAHLGPAVFGRLVQCCQELETLKYSGCRGGIGETMAGGRIVAHKLTELDLSGGTLAADQSSRDLINSCIAFGTMRRLDLRDANIDDEAVKHLARACGKSLRQMRLCRSTKVGFLGIAAIAEHCRLLHDLTLHSIPRVNDKAAVLLSRKCRKLRVLDMGHCEALLTASIGLIGSMRSLVALDASSWLDDDAVKSLPPTLRALKASDCPRLTDSGGMQLLAQRCRRLRAVDVAGSAVTSRTTIAIVGPVTSPFPRLAQVHALVFSHDASQELVRLIDSHPYLELTACAVANTEDDFCGLCSHPHHHRSDVSVIRRTDALREKLTKDEIEVDRKRSVAAATLMQRNYRAMVARREEFQRWFDLEAQSDFAARQVQRFARGMRARRRARTIRRVRQMARFVSTSVATAWARRRLRRRAEMLRERGRICVLRRYVVAWKRVERKKNVDDPVAVKRARDHHRHCVLGKLLLAWRRATVPQEDSTKAGVAKAFWARRRKKPLFMRWRRIANIRKARRKKLVIVFMQCARIETHNAEVSAARARRAMAHTRNKTIRQVFGAWKVWFMTESPMRRRCAAAAERIKALRFQHDVPRVFRALQLYAAHCRFKKRRDDKVTQSAIEAIRLRSTTRRLHRHASTRRHVRHAQSVAERFLSRVVLESFRRHCEVRKRSRRADYTADVYRESMSLVHFERRLLRWHLNAMEMRRIRCAYEQARLGAAAANARAALARFRFCFLVWRAKRAASGALVSCTLDTAVAVATASVTAATVSTLFGQIASKKSRLQLLECKRDVSLERWDQTVDEFLRTVRAVVRVQSIIRVRKAARAVDEFRTNRDYSILILQKNARRWFAYRALKRERRHRRARELVSAENERMAMEAEEEWTKNFLRNEVLWHRVERVVRTYLSRKRTASLRAQIVRQKSAAFFRRRALDLADAEEALRENEAEVKRRNQAATVIQKRRRGALGRRRFRRKLGHALESLAAAKCQSAYRGTLGRRRAAALRRDAANYDLLVKNRQRQGALLRRFLRKEHRASQRALLKLLVPLGLDPLSFTLLPSTQLAELCQDASDFIADLRIEYEVGRRAGYFDFYQRGRVRNELRDARYGKRCQVSPGDAVRIVDPSHPRRGETAFLAAIDKSIPENFVAELTFDRDGTHASLPMVCSADIFSGPANALTKIPSLDKPRSVVEAKAVRTNRNELIKRAAGARPRAEASKAALKIQRFARRGLAVRRVARVRYRFWRDSHARRRILLSTLEATGATHLGAVKVLSRTIGIAADGLQIDHFVDDLPAWESTEFDPYSAPPAYAASRRRRLRRRNIHVELKERLRLRRLRVKNLRRGATPNKAVRGVLFGGLSQPQTQGQKRAAVSVNEDHENDVQKWKRFAKATPVSRTYRGDYNISRISRYVLAVKLNWLDFAHKLYGADAVLHLALSKSAAAQRSSKQRDTSLMLLPDDFGRAARADAARSFTRRIDIHKQFGGSPHLRVSHVALYHGAWPSGEGLVEFLDGYACAEEEKTLTIKLIRARELRAMDLTTSDPYAKVTCNNHTFRSRTKRETLEPEFHELFEVDVSDPKARLEVSLWDWDRLTADDYLGGCSIQLGALPKDQVERGYRARYLLGDLEPYTFFSRTNRLDRHQAHDRGYVELELCWVEKQESDDLDLRRSRRRGAVKLEAWVRGRLASIERKKRALKARAAKQLVDDAGNMIQKTYRAMKSRRFLKRLRAQLRAASRLQCFFRRRLAFVEIQRLRTTYHAALRLQIVARRRFVAPMMVARLRLQLWIESNYAALTMQGFLRCCLARRRRAHFQIMAQQRRRPDAVAETSLSWLAWYGRDRVYGSKRSRRIATRAVQNMLGTPHTRIRTIYGPALVGRIRNDDTLSISILGCREPSSVALSRAERTEMLSNAHRHYAVIRVEDGFLAKASVTDRVIAIQCQFRFRLACRRVLRLLDEYIAASVIVRCARRRLRFVHDAATEIQALGRVLLGKYRAEFLRHEIWASVKVQKSYRQRMALRQVEDRRKARCLPALVSSEFSSSFSGQRTLDGNPDTFWCSRACDVSRQSIVYDMSTPTCIGIVELSAPDSTTAPRIVSIDVSDSVSEPFETLFSVELPPPPSHAALADVLENKIATDPRGVEVQRRVDRGVVVWSRLELPSEMYCVTRFWRLSLIKNWSSTEGMRLNGVRWLRAKEFSPIIEENPSSFFMEVGPQVGSPTPIVELCCKALAWPEPSFQWYKNGEILKGATSSTLKVQESIVEKSIKTKKFRCTHCRKVNREVPRNVYRNLCQNCHSVFDWPEQEASAVARHAFTSRFHELETQLKQLARRICDTKDTADSLALQLRLQGDNEQSIGEAKKTPQQQLTVPLSDHLSEEPIAASRRQRRLAKLAPKQRLNELLAALSELDGLRTRAEDERNSLIFEALLVKESGRDAAKLDYECEGVYECIVSNVRAGSIVRVAKSEPAAIYVGDPLPLKTRVVEDFRPLPRTRRKRFDRYVSMHGFFEQGRLVGDVVAKFASGDAYCGPLVAETCLDRHGASKPEGRSPDHWGRWVSGSTIYEGASVDNHFDVSNIVGDFRVTFEDSKGKYDGEMVDGKRHGIGEYWYADGSKYKGEWHRDMRQGFGRLEDGGDDDSCWYEGEWDRDRIHGAGVWHWRDGSSYAGDVVDGTRQGKGVYVSKTRDVYVGDFEENQMHGYGTLTYHDGSKFEGHFDANERDGLGVFTDVRGVRYFGRYSRGVRHGEFLVRRPVAAADDMDEIQQGMWELGEFVDWTTPPINPVATTQFCDMFEKCDEEYDGVYALMIARRLPLLPHGVQPDHPRVVPIIDRIRREGGLLVAVDTYNDAKAELLEVSPALEETTFQMRIARDEIARHTDFVREKEKVVDQAEMQLRSLVKRQRQLQSQVNTFWDEEDATGVRRQFDEIVAEIESIPVRDFFVVRYFPEPPHLLEKILRATCAVVGEPESWKAAQLLLSASQQNAEAGDQQALVAPDYEVKLKHILATFDVWARAEDEEAMRRVAGMLVDPRFSPDHHHVTSYGIVPPALVKLVRVAYAYVQRTSAIRKVKNDLDAIVAQVRHAEIRKSEAESETEEAKVRFEAKKAALEETEREGRRAERRVQRLRSLVIQCEDMIEEYHSDEEDLPEDYYSSLDQQLSKDPRHDVAIVLDMVCNHVTKIRTQPEPGSERWMRARGLVSVMLGGRKNTPESRRLAAEEWKVQQDRELAQIAVDAALKKMPPPGECFDINSFIRHTAKRAMSETLEKISHYYSGGKRYFGEPPDDKTVLVRHHAQEDDLEKKGGNDILDESMRSAAELVRSALRQSALRMDAGGHSDAHVKVAVASSPQRVDLGFVDVLIRKEWYDESRETAIRAACASWEAAFPPVSSLEDASQEEFCASPEYMAISARTNWIMKGDAVAEAAIWESEHRESIVFAEARLAATFEAEHEATEQGTARAALQIRQNREYGCDAVAAATVWCKLHPDLVMEAKLDDEFDMLSIFAEKYQDQSALVAARILAGVSPRGFEDDECDGSSELKAATAWADANLDAFVEAQTKVGDELAETFADVFPADTAIKAVRAQIQPDTPSRFRAAGRAWKARNRRAFDDAYDAIQAQQEVEDDQKAKEIEKILKDKELSGGKENLLVELVEWRVNMRELKMKRLEEDYERCKADRSYLVCSKRARPSHVEEILADQKKRHFEKVDACQAAFVVEAARLSHLKDLLHTLTKKEDEYYWDPESEQYYYYDAETDQCYFYSEESMMT